MRVKVRLIAVLAALSFAVASMIPMFLPPGDSVAARLHDMLKHPLSSLAFDFAPQAWIFFVGYAIWGVFFRKACATRRRALVCGVFAGLATAIIAPTALMFGWRLQIWFSGGGWRTVSWSGLLRAMVSPDAMLGNAIQLGGLSLVGWCFGWLIPIDSPTARTGSGSYAAVSASHDARPRGDTEGTGESHAALRFKGAI